MTAYRHTARPVPLQFPKTPWWRLLRAWANGTLRRLRMTREQRAVARDAAIRRSWRLVGGPPPGPREVGE